MESESGGGDGSKRWGNSNSRKGAVGGGSRVINAKIAPSGIASSRVCDAGVRKYTNRSVQEERGGGADGHEKKTEIFNICRIIAQARTLLTGPFLCRACRP